MDDKIEEFASDLCEEFDKNEYDNYYWLSMDSAKTIVKGLIAKGYRKESDTARGILTELKNTRFHKGTLTYDFEMALNKIAEKHGVDLGE
jgi:hypothetical protein